MEKLDGDMKVTVQSSGYVTRAGYVSSKWYEFFIVVGRNPVGPRGGKCGNYVDGHQVGSRFRKYDDALKAAQQLVAEKGYELI
jgi:hypothetical protein